MLQLNLSLPPDPKAGEIRGLCLAPELRRKDVHGFLNFEHSQHLNSKSANVG